MDKLSWPLPDPGTSSMPQPAGASQSPVSAGTDIQPHTAGHAAQWQPRARGFR